MGTVKGLETVVVVGLLVKRFQILAKDKLGAEPEKEKQGNRWRPAGVARFPHVPILVSAATLALSIPIPPERLN